MGNQHKKTKVNWAGIERGNYVVHKPDNKKDCDDNQSVMRSIGKIVTVHHLRELRVEQTGFNPDSYTVETIDGYSYEVMEASDLELEITNQPDQCDSQTRVRVRTIINAVKKYREKVRN